MIARRLRLLGIGPAMAFLAQAPVAAAAHAARHTATATCATRPRPSGKVLRGYWENWDGSKGWTFGNDVKALQGR